MVKIVIKHEVKPSVLWPIETSLEYLYERTVRPFHALIDLLYHGRFKGNDQERSLFEVERVVSLCDSTRTQRPRRESYRAATHKRGPPVASQSRASLPPSP